MNSMNVLILGSAPYAPDWWQEHGREYAGWEIATLNNAVTIPSHQKRTWWHSQDGDFSGLEIDAQVTELVVHKDCLMSPFTYPGFKNGTVMLTVCYNYLNLAHKFHRQLTIHVAGSDYHYPHSKSHFYGDGGADPLRHGELWLRDELALLDNLAKSRGFEIWNAGGRNPSLLPFKRTP